MPEAEGRDLGAESAQSDWDAGGSKDDCRCAGTTAGDVDGTSGTLEEVRRSVLCWETTATPGREVEASRGVGVRASGSE